MIDAFTICLGLAGAWSLGATLFAAWQGPPLTSKRESLISSVTAWRPRLMAKDLKTGWMTVDEVRRLAK